MRLSSNRVAGSLLRIVGRTPLAKWTVTVRSGVAAGARWTIFPFSAYWRKGGAEPHLDTVIRKYGCTPGGVCWDLGAHFGIYTVGMAMHVGASGQICAVEPDPVSFKRLSHHVSLNHLATVKLINAAAGEKTGISILHSYRGWGGTESHLAFEGENLSLCPNQISVETVALDELVDRGLIREPGFIKIDVEGAAGSVLRGMRRVLEQSRPVILLSFHCADEVEGATSILRCLGYNAFDTSDSGVAWPALEYRGERLFR